jgi:ComF family protein
MITIRDFIGLFFPKVCEGCGNLLFKNENTICTRCITNLPKTNFHTYHDNPVMENFMGKVNVVSSTSFLYYAKAGNVQQMIHNFKYHKKLEVGRILGRMFATDISSSPFFGSVKVVIPVPLHWSKIKTRGFNQSEIIARAMAGVLNTTVETDVLLRPFATDTQTKKSRIQRVENVSGKFQLKNEEKISGKHVLLVDDVITTGSTMESCAELLNRVEGVKLSIASLGFASK